MKFLSIEGPCPYLRRNSSSEFRGCDVIHFSTRLTLQQLLNSIDSIDLQTGTYQRENRYPKMTEATETVSINIDHFICPISLEMMKDPVICEDGITYERDAISQWFETHNTSPKTNAILYSKNLIPNIALKAGITKYLTEQEERSAGAKRKIEDAVVEQPAKAVRRMPARVAKKVRESRLQNII